MRATSLIATAAVGRPGRISDASPSDGTRLIAPGPVFERGRLESRISPDRRRGQPRLLSEMLARTAEGAGRHPGPDAPGHDAGPAPGYRLAHVLDRGPGAEAAGQKRSRRADREDGRGGRDTPDRSPHHRRVFAAVES